MVRCQCVRLPLFRPKHVHKWRIVYVGSDIIRYFDESLKPRPTAAAGDIAIGRGCILRVCEECGAREVVRNVHLVDGPASRNVDEDAQKS